MLQQKLYATLLLIAVSIELLAALQPATTATQTSKSPQPHESASTSTRTARIMKILKDPAPLVKRNRGPPPLNLQPRRDRFPPNQQRPLPIVYHRPVYGGGGGTRNQMLRRVQSGPPPPPPNTALRPQQAFAYEPVKSTRYAPGHKDNLPPPNFGKAAVYRTQFTNAPHPNALAPAREHSQQYIQNFKASPPFNGNVILRPASDYPQYNALLTPAQAEIKQYPLPQQPPQHQQQISQQRPQTNTAPQMFPVAPQQQQPQQQQPTKQYTEALLKSVDNAAPQTYSVYEDPELTEHASLQYNSQQNPLAFNPNFAATQQQQQLQPHNQPQQHHQHPQQVTPASKEAEDYLRFMSTNEYFLPKLNPNYKKLDEEKDLHQYKQFRKQHEQQSLQSFQYSKTLPSPVNKNAATISFHEPIQVSKLFYDHDPSPSSTVVRGSYQTGSNVFVVNSDGNKAIKHIVPSSLAPQGTTTPSIVGGNPYNNARYNAINHRTPEPIRFEFTERDAVLAGHTNSPPLNGNQHYHNGVVPTPAGVINHNRPISVNEVDADPEDGDDMQEAGTDFYGRVPIRSSTENSADGKKISTTTPATEQKDTEEYCESICANVQDENAEIICGSDGYMYTGEAQMECYASCLHIDVTIQGKGSCSAR